MLQTPLGGRRCEILGLQRRSDLNGLAGVAGKYSPDSDRYAFVVKQTKEHVLVKTANLKRRDRTPLDPGVFLKYRGKNLEGRNIFTKELFFSTREEAEAFQKLQQEKEKSNS